MCNDPNPREELELLVELANDPSERTLENFTRMVELMEQIDPEASLEDIAQALALDVFYTADELTGLSGIGLIDYPEAPSLELNDELRQALQALGPLIDRNFKMVQRTTPDGEQFLVNMGHAMAAIDCHSRGHMARADLYSFGGDILKSPFEGISRLDDWINGRESDRTTEPASLTGDDWAGNELGVELRRSFNQLGRQGSEPRLSVVIVSTLPKPDDLSQVDPGGIDIDAEPENYEDPPDYGPKPETPELGSDPDVDEPPGEIDDVEDGDADSDADVDQEVDPEREDEEPLGSDVDVDGPEELYVPQSEGMRAVPNDSDRDVEPEPDYPEEAVESHGDDGEYEPDLQGSDADADFNGSDHDGSGSSRGADVDVDIDPEDADDFDEGDPDADVDFNQPDDGEGSSEGEPFHPEDGSSGGADADMDVDPEDVDDFDEGDVDSDIDTEEPR